MDIERNCVSFHIDDADNRKQLRQQRITHPSKRRKTKQQNSLDVIILDRTHSKNTTIVIKSEEDLSLNITSCEKSSAFTPFSSSANSLLKTPLCNSTEDLPLFPTTVHSIVDSNFSDSCELEKQSAFCAKEQDSKNYATNFNVDAESETEEFLTYDEDFIAKENESKHYYDGTPDNIQENIPHVAQFTLPSPIYISTPIHQSSATYDNPNEKLNKSLSLEKSTSLTNINDSLNISIDNDLQFNNSNISSTFDKLCENVDDHDKTVTEDGDLLDVSIQ